MAVSKRLKFEILRRDGFACRYCGAKAPETSLTVDHVVPVALGGTDEPTNLAAACSDCNSGKTSSNPDAPLVSQVNNDAVRWGAAMRAAAAKMLSDIEARRVDRDQFRQWWSEWTYADRDERRTIPMGSDWESSVDQFLAAGLPLAVLKTCIDHAMRRQKVSPENTFRYMCGIAWKKIAELQRSARSFAAAEEHAGVDDEEKLSPEIARGRADLAGELLGFLPNEEREQVLADARETYEPDSEDELITSAAHMAWHASYISNAWLLFSVCEVLPLIPDPVMAEAVREARVKLYDECGPGFSQDEWANRVMSIATARYLGIDALEDGVPF